MIAPKRWTVTRLARDGVFVNRASPASLPRSAKALTHLVISAGGNDALHHSGVLDAPAASAAQVLSKLANIQDTFRQGYRRMLDAARNLKLATAVCTVYEARFPELRRRLAALALSVIDDAIGPGSQCRLRKNASHPNDGPAGPGGGSRYEYTKG